MNDTSVCGYTKKSKKTLLKEIEKCQSLSQLFAIIQHEHIVIQMHSQSGASNIKSKTLAPNQIIEKKNTPLERLKREIYKAVQEK